MNINDIKIPTFKESWKDFTDNYTLNQPLFFVLIQNKYLMQYADGYLYPVPFEFNPESLMRNYTPSDKIRYLAEMMKHAGCSEVKTREAENYPPYCTLFSLPENLDNLSLIFFVRDVQLNNDELCYISYCPDFDCKIGGLCCGKWQEDENIFLLPKEFDSVHRKDIVENSIYIGAKCIGNSAFKDKWQHSCRTHDIEKYPEFITGDRIYFCKLKECKGMYS
ncbi:hypothetical protein bpr_II318 (plasmid) [Butyrivibrio proteoclasticus B316]|uniref:Uncharacterized protein n=1 Tax=Butyrivibrio proteoclasticus (strain ATCC 51982 / DSM 14932 / B316) TaxID=515622 RepID=E0S4C3_BUTPB|nr:hypothetical protein [Butyrivibrio proteoclasticus]ADL36255.1 hypothetical protein bpr_II318 [Butyrivibrio proteoclasticus B316]